MTREEFIGRAADAVLAHIADPDGNVFDQDQDEAVVLASEAAEAALDAVGAWGLLEALVALRDAVRANPAMNGMRYDGLGVQVNAAIAKASGR